jgi:hypothetical protein
MMAREIIIDDEHQPFINMQNHTFAPELRGAPKNTKPAMNSLDMLNPLLQTRPS